MLQYNRDTKMVNIYSNYGVTIEGKWNHYISSVDGKENEALVDLTITDPKGNKYNYKLCNNFIIDTIVDEYKDEVCYYVAYMFTNEEALENLVWDEWAHNRGLTLHHVRQSKMRAKRERERAEMQAKIKAEREQKRNGIIHELDSEAKKRKLDYLIDYTTVYFIKSDKKNAHYVKQAKENDKWRDNVIKFATEYPGHGVDIVETRHVADLWI